MAQIRPCIPNPKMIAQFETAIRAVSARLINAQRTSMNTLAITERGFSLDGGKSKEMKPLSHLDNAFSTI